MTSDIRKAQANFFEEFGNILSARYASTWLRDLEGNIIDKPAADFARYLRAARSNAGLSRSELAAQAQISEAEIVSLELDIIPSAQIEMGLLHALARALGEDVWDFVLLLEREIPIPSPTGIRARLVECWEAWVAFLGSVRKVFFAFALMAVALTILGLNGPPPPPSVVVLTLFIILIFLLIRMVCYKSRRLRVHDVWNRGWGRKAVYATLVAALCTEVVGVSLAAAKSEQASPVPLHIPVIANYGQVPAPRSDSLVWEEHSLKPLRGKPQTIDMPTSIPVSALVTAPEPGKSPYISPTSQDHNLPLPPNPPSLDPLQSLRTVSPNRSSVPGSSYIPYPKPSATLMGVQDWQDGTPRDFEDPVSTATGNLVHSTVDIQIPGIGGTPLILERTYNSRSTDTETGPLGLGWALSYDVHLVNVDEGPLHQGVQIQYADGRTVLFTANGDGTYTPDSVRNFDTLTREGDQFVLRHKYTLEVERFNDQGQLIAIEDRNGNAITFTYDGKYLGRVENASGRWISFTYDDDGLITMASMPEGLALYYEYTGGLLTGFVDGRGGRTEYRYDENGLLSAVITPEGHPTVHVTYDPVTRRVIEQIVGENQRYTFAYDDANRRLTQTDAYGTETVHHYNDEKQLVQIDHPDGTSELFEYDEGSNRTYYRDQLGREWHWNYDDQGNKITEAGPLGWYREWEYNNLGLVTRQAEHVDASAVRETVFTYDSFGNLIRTCNALGDCSRIRYDEQGLATDIWDLGGNRTRYSYDAAGNLTTLINAEGETTRFAYGGLGRVVKIELPLGNTYTYAYDANGNLVAVDGPLGYHLGYQYDGNGNLVVETDPNGGETAYHYDASGRLVHIENQLGFAVATYTYGLMDEIVSLQDAEGGTWRYKYDVHLQVTGVYGPLDTFTSYGYDAMGNITDVTDPRGYVTHFEYDALDRPIAVTQNYRPGESEGSDTNVTTKYVYDLMGNILRVLDPEDHPTEYKYDLLDQMTGTRDAEGGKWEYEYDPMGNVILAVNPRGHKTTFEYDGVNHRTKIIDALGGVTVFAYDADGNLTDIIDPLGIVIHYDYDALDRLTRQVHNHHPGKSRNADINVTTTYMYDLAGNLRFVIDPRGNETEYRYDKTHRLTDVFGYEDAHTHYAYDNRGNLLIQTDANGYVITYTYDDLDRLIVTTDAEAHSARYTYDEASNLTSVIDANGNTTSFEYDALGRRVRMVDALGGEQLYEYDHVGNLVVKTDANGHTTTYAYDSTSRLRAVTDAIGNITQFSWDACDNLIKMVNGNDHPIRYSYDELGRLVAIINPEDETTRYSYDVMGRRTHLLEADGTVTLYVYDPLGRLTSVTQNYIEGSLNNNNINLITRYVYDAGGNLVQNVDANGSVTYFEYDGAGRLVREVNPLGHTWEYTYDGMGNRLTRLDANGTLTQYSYYPDNQLKRVDYKDGISVAYWYDPSNNNTKMVDGLGTTTWTYDALGRITNVEDPFECKLRFDYDGVGNRTKIVYPDGSVISYTYYGNDWLRTVTGPENSVIYTYDGVGNLTRILEPNSVTTDIAYDSIGRVRRFVSHKTISGKSVAALEYSYDEAGLVAQILGKYGWHNSPTVVGTYTYDELHRLVEAENSEGLAMTYTYDKAGNRTSWIANDDPATPLPSDGFSASYTYDAANRLIKAAVEPERSKNHNTVEYTYDANGNRTNREISAPDSSKGTDYHYDSENRLTVVQDYQLEGGETRIDNSVTTFVYDGNGRRLAKHHGQSKHNYRYDPYGGMVLTSDDFTDPHNHYRLAGKAYDEQTELVYFGGRYYDPTAGGWLTQTTTNLLNLVREESWSPRVPVGLEVLGLGVAADAMSLLTVNGSLVGLHVWAAAGLITMQLHLYQALLVLGYSALLPLLLGIVVLIITHDGKGILSSQHPEGSFSKHNVTS